MSPPVFDTGDQFKEVAAHLSTLAGHVVLRPGTWCPAQTHTPTDTHTYPHKLTHTHTHICPQPCFCAWPQVQGFSGFTAHFHASLRPHDTEMLLKLESCNRTVAGFHPNGRVLAGFGGCTKRIKHVPAAVRKMAAHNRITCKNHDIDALVFCLTRVVCQQALQRLSCRLKVLPRISLNKSAV